MDAPTPRTRDLAVTAALVALTLGLRVPWLGAVPTACGDEGNWSWFGLELFLAKPVAWAPEARFVSLLFAHLIAWSYRALGVSIASARAVLVVGVTLAVPAVVLAGRRAGLQRGHWIIAALLAAHPWSVLWSRTVTVPYALSFALSLLAPLLALASVREPARSVWPWALGLCVGLSVHFSPLSVVPALAVVAWALHPLRRSLWRAPSTWGAALVATLVASPVLRGALHVAAAGATRPQHHWTNLAARIAVFARTLVGGVDGEATLRHVTGTQFGAPGEAALALAVVALVALALRGPSSPLVSLARWHTALAVVVTPLLLAPARPWNLPAIDTDRYLFVVIAPFALCLAALAETARWRHIAMAATLYLGCVPTARGLWYFARGGGPDRGFYTAAGGGGARGWKVARERRALGEMIRDEVERARQGEPAQVVMADYAFHPLHFFHVPVHVPCVNVAMYPLSPRPGVLHVFVVWSPGVFAPGFWPRDAVDDNARLVALMRSDVFEPPRRLRVFTQPDGAALVEVWAARRKSRDGDASH